MNYFFISNFLYIFVLKEKEYNDEKIFRRYKKTEFNC